MEPGRLRDLNCEPKLILPLVKLPPSGVCHSDRKLPDTAILLVKNLRCVDRVLQCAGREWGSRGHSCPLSLRDISCCLGGAGSEHKGCVEPLVSITSSQSFCVSTGDKAGLSFSADSLLLISPRYINCHGLGRQGNSSHYR